MRYTLKPETVLQPKAGTVLLYKSNSLGASYHAPTLVEWFAVGETAFVVPETVNGFYYVLDDGRAEEH